MTKDFPMETKVRSRESGRSQPARRSGQLVDEPVEPVAEERPDKGSAEGEAVVFRILIPTEKKGF